MRLTWKDGMATLLVAFVAAVTLAMEQAWGWPLLGSYRSTGLLVFALGMLMCTVGGSALRMADDMKDPYVRFASALGTLTLLALVGVLIWGTQAWFLALVIDIAVLWAMTTLRHAFAHTARRRASPMPAG